MKHLLKIFFLFLLSTSLFISCTSSKEDDVEAMAESEMLDDGGESLDDLDAALDGDGDFGDDDFGFDDGEGEFADDKFADDDFFADDGFAEESKEDEFAASDDFATADSEEIDEFAAPLEDDGFAGGSDDFATDSSFGDDGGAFADSGDTFGSEDAGFSEVDSFDDSGSDFTVSGDGFEEVEPERDWVPVKKMATTPFQKGGQLLNTIYIIRPSDTMESVSQKIYGSDRSQDLYAANPHLHRSFTVGDKMYYNSPNRPNDSSQTITYYEDVGIPAQTYISQEGDNIRQVASQLMGHPDSWKEMWAINMSVESKGQIAGGLELRYFPEDAVPAQNIAQNQPEPMPEPQQDSEPGFNDQAMNNDIPPPPPPPGSGEDMDDPELVAGSVEPPPPPPKIEPPPPPPPPPVESQGQQAKVDSQDGKGIFSNMKLILAAILLIGGGLAILVIQKNKSKKINIGETQI